MACASKFPAIVRVEAGLVMALQTEGVSICHKHFVVVGTVRLVASGAVFALHSVMLKHKGTSHFRMAADAGFIQTVPGVGGETIVRIMTIATHDLTFQDPMSEGHAEVGHFRSMALQTELRFISEIGCRFGFNLEVDLIGMAVRTADSGTLVGASRPTDVS